MSNHKNHRRGEGHRTEHGPRYENADPGAGCNSTHVAKSRKEWRDMGRRRERRTGKSGANGGMFYTRRQVPPPIEDEGEGT